MNIIEKALQDLRYEIPREVLEYVFNDRLLRRAGIPVSIDTIIKEKVIYERVIVDCNLYSARMIEISLSGLDHQVYSNGGIVFRIPKSRTDGCSIVSVHSVTFGSYGYGIGMAGAQYNMNSSQLLNITQGVLESALAMGSNATTKVSVIDENVVLIKELQQMPDEIHLKAMIANDSTMSHIKPASYKKFGKLVELAVKAYCYINKSIPLDEGMIRSGVNLDRMRDFIDSYSDANEMYNEYLEMEWRKVAVANDDPTMRDIISSQISIQR